MTITKKCDLCETTLEFEADGQRLAFIAHTPEMCRAGAKELIADLKQALVSQREVYERAMRHVVRDADRTLAEAGLETLTQRGKRYDAQALIGLHQAGMLDLSSSELKL